MNKVFRVTWVNSEPQLTLWLLSLLERLVVLNIYECKNPWQVGNWVDYFSQDLDEEWTDWEDEEKRKSSGKSWKRFAQKWHLNVYLCYFFFKINLSIFIFLSTPWRLNGLDRTCVTQIRHRVSIQKNINIVLILNFCKIPFIDIIKLLICIYAGEGDIQCISTLLQG